MRPLIIATFVVFLAPLPALAGYGEQPTSALRIVVIDGEDAVNVIQQKTAVAPVVEVRDRNNQPVAGAIVNFAVRSGRATFGGARTLSVTTNTAGRAIAAGFAPTGSGALQISATAAFQGQTAAAVTIAQTTVQTVAEAAALSSAGAGAGGSGGSVTAGAGTGAGGGGGGLSATTIGIIGGAAAGGLVAVKELGGGVDPTATVVTTTYRGSFSMQAVFNSTTTTNGVVTGFCANQPVSITGNITVTLDERGAGDVEADWTENIGAAGFCPGIGPGFHAGGRVMNASNIMLSSDTGTADYPSPAGTVHLRRSWTFSGALASPVVNGIVTMSHDLTLIAPAGPGIAVTGGYPTASTAVTLTKQ